jgi:ATP-binding cassette subfamily F protein uup
MARCKEDGMGFLISCQSVSKAYGHRPLFQEITLGIDEGEKVGLIGPNGAGKSTLLNILAGYDKPDEGEVSQRRGVHLGFVTQSESFDTEETSRSILLSALSDTHMDIHERELEVTILLSRLDFSQSDVPIKNLSGGWLKRLAIASELLLKPDLLLLDEPTNHLDIEGILWLEKLLLEAPFASIIVTHDRYFLENVTTRIVELNRVYAGGFLSVDGCYSAFLEEREAYLARQEHTEQALSSIARKEIEWLRRNPQARTTKAKGRIESANQLLDNLADVRFRNMQEKKAAIEFAGSGRKTKELLTAKSISKSLGGKQLFLNLDITLSPGCKYGLLGQNGSGKTTLLRTLAGELEPDEGNIRFADSLRLVVFDQNRTPLNQEDTLRNSLSPNGETVMYRGQSIHVAGWAKRFLFSPQQLDQTVRFLSGGEQARLMIARLMLEPADVLLLDEPTNDLDIASIEALEETLSDFPGALVLVTHDRFLLDRLCTHLLALDGNGRTSYISEYAQWERILQDRNEDKSQKKENNLSKPLHQKPIRLTTSEKKELLQMEETILSSEAEVERLEKALISPEVATSADKLQKTWEELAQARDSVIAAYARWEELERKQEITSNVK